MARVIPYKLSLWKDITAVYNTEVPDPSKLKINQIIYVITDVYLSGIPYTTVYKGLGAGTSPQTYLYQYKRGSQVVNGETTIDKIRVGKQVFEEMEVEELASDKSTFEGRAYNINLTQNINGMNTLTFSIPKKYFDRKEGKMVKNHLPDMIWNKNKIKLKYKDKWFTFIVNDRVERREDKKIIYDFTCEDMLINELSRTGYSLTFDEEHGGIGTLDDLAPKVLAGTDWEYIPTSENDFIEKRKTYQEDEDGNIEFDSDGFPIEKEETISTQKSEYNEIVGRAVYQYKYIKDGVTHETWPGTTEKIWGYNTNKTVTSDIARNLIYNSKEYTDSTGWKSGTTGTGDSKVETMSVRPVATWNKDDTGAITSAKYTLKLTAVQANAWAYNDTMKSARTQIEEGEKYLLKITFTGTAPVVALANSTNFSYDSSFITDKYTVTNNGYFALTPNKTTSTAYLAFNLAAADQFTEITNVELFQVKPKTGSSSEKSFIQKLSGKLSAEQISSLSNNIIMPDSTIDAYSEVTVQLFYNLDSKTVEYVTLPEGATLEKVMYDNAKKVRTLKEEKSNRYNILQTLAELFEGWIRFEVEYLENGKIKRDSNGKQIKKIKFVEVVGKDNWNGFHYGTNLTSISRTINSEQVVSKIWVETTDSKSSESGIISIQDSEYNKLGELFLYNFDYYVKIGEISEQQLLNDMYGTSNDNLGFITKMQAENKKYKDASTKYNGLSNTVQKLKTERDGTILRIQSAKENITTLARGVPATNNIYSGTYFQISVPKGDMIGSADQQKEAKNSIIRWGTSINDLYAYLKTLNAQLGYRDNSATDINDIIFENESEAEKYEITEEEAKEKNLPIGYIIQMKKALKGVQDITNIKKGLVTEFEEKYMRYITEGTWQDDNYTDSDKYYFDAERVLATSAMPTASYTIDVLALQALEGWENYTFDIGDKTFVTDIDFFGFDKNGSPYKQEVVISEVTDVIDSQNSSTITVQNFRTQFEDLFSRISASVQTLQMKDQIYSRAENFTANGEILAPILQNTLINNSITLAQAVDQSVIVNDRGIEVTDIFNPNKKLRVVADGIYISSDGGLNWTSGLTASGMNANFITTGQLDTNRLRIMNGAFPSFVWDKLGLTAYQIYLDSKKEERINSENHPIGTGGFVRFDQHGMYIVPDGSDAEKFGYDSDGIPWFASEEIMGNKKDGGFWENGYVTWFDRLNYIQKNTSVSLTWRGLNIKSSTGSVEIGTDLPAIRIFDKRNTKIPGKEDFKPPIDPIDYNICRVELGFQDDGNGGITQRGDWNVELKQGNETLYGLVIRNSIGQTVLRTSKDGSLWLKENLFIGGAAATEIDSKIGIQASGRNTNADGTPFEGENKFILWSKSIGDFASQGKTDWFDTFTIDDVGAVTANAITIIGDSQFHGQIAATSGHFENQMGLGSTSVNKIFDSGFSASTYYSYFTYSPLEDADKIFIGYEFYLKEADKDYYSKYTISMIEQDGTPEVKYYYREEGENKEVSRNEMFKIVENFKDFPIDNNEIDRDKNYAIWVRRLNFDENGTAISERTSPNFYVTHNGQLYASNAIITGQINVSSGKVTGLLEVGDNIQINGENSSISVFYTDKETGEERRFSVNAEAEVEADSIKIGRDAFVKDYILLGDNFVLSNPNSNDYRKDVVIMAGEYETKELKEALNSLVYSYRLVTPEDNISVGTVIWIKEVNEDNVEVWKRKIISKIDSNGDQKTYYYDKDGVNTKIDFNQIYFQVVTEDGTLFPDAMNKAKLIITSKGQLSASSLDIRGKESRISGDLKIYSEDSSSAITISSEKGIFTSSKDGQVTSGWRIDKDGSAEFQNVNVRGTISSSVMKYKEIQVSSGNLLIRPASKIARIFEGIDIAHGQQETYNFVTVENAIELKDGDRVMIQVSRSNSRESYSIIGTAYWISTDYPDVSSQNVDTPQTISEEETKEFTNIVTKTLVRIYKSDIDESLREKFAETLDLIDNRGSFELVKSSGELVAGRRIFLKNGENGGFVGYYLVSSNIEENKYTYFVDSSGTIAETTFDQIYLKYKQNYSDLILINLGGVNDDDPSKNDGGIALNATKSNDGFGNALTINIYQYERKNPKDKNSEIIKRDKVVLGDLNNISDESFSDTFGTPLLKGFGLYTENAFIKGTISTGKAGLTTVMSNEVLLWAGGVGPSHGPVIPKTALTPSGEEIILSEEERIKLEIQGLESGQYNPPNFYIKENGFLFAKAGYFSGTIRSTDAEISGTIGTQGLRINNKDTGIFVSSNEETEGEDGQIVLIEKIHAAINEAGVQIYSGGDLEIYKDKIYFDKDNTKLPPNQFNPYIYSDDDLEGLVLHKLVVSDIPEINDNEPTTDRGIVFSQNEIVFKKTQNTELGIDKKRRVLNLDNMGASNLRLSYKEEESTTNKASGNHFNIEVDGSNPLKVYKEVVSVKNLEVSETVYFDEIVMGKAILRRAKETKADGTIVDKGLDIFVV
jgi:hypothetical protein